ncbi:hypothetical protein AVEN_751-1 [Araneus ventricosus]|uniref:Transposase Tc1-like domain-containing protein n=1 Tax=Araneus ventricosus TaxID=182803 RepID=A0A4Y2RL17_ARAVE|nr:hypothetical protein AVEN_751-1 [Araneus ventricosus]
MDVRRTILPQTAADFNDGVSTSVSVCTAQRAIINMGSQSRRPTRVPLLTALHKALLLSWARQHYHWTVDDWKHVTWSDESRFQLYRTDARSMETTSLIHRPCLSTGDCSIWWSLSDGMGRVQLA